MSNLNWKRNRDNVRMHTPTRKRIPPWWRPNVEKNVDIEEMKKWARAGCTLGEIAQRLGISSGTLADRLKRDNYREALESARAEMIISLRSKQIAVALSGNVPMLIWTGKQYCGQRDQMAHSGIGPNGEIEISNVTALDRIKAELERFRGGAVGPPAAIEAGSDTEIDF